MRTSILTSKLSGINGGWLLCLNRCDRANAYNETMLIELDQFLTNVIADKSVRCIVISGSGDRAFCAGADRDELAGRRAKDGLDLLSRSVFDKLATLPAATIARINGAAIGGGLELALACDVRVSAPDAVFALPELALGIAPGAGALRRLPSAVGLARAMEMVLFGVKIDAPTAAAWGMVSYQGSDYEDVVKAYADYVCSCDPLAVRLTKTVLATTNGTAQMQLEATAQALLYELRYEKSALSERAV
ncbi:enoyl-CoA hydratase/carnithine racemase [Rhizobium sp. BK650]|uniref:enoyl-CoA hydratase/isomerase family protein n=1 Tax=Rhizobium sp. BK650 TaxID=2586990 RepID=UPI001619862D|nr:enoyl-CoA hydratase/isomerase family protein [Rhizobium sp. BK650]MBB3660992.1 enoyl-CoA hydratase/carnithine racemase [Rhizobium sp. BK650]